MININSKQLSERVILYNSSLVKKNHSSGITDLHNQIIDDIRILIYSFPEETHLLDTEDASEFLLYMEPKIENIIKNYRNIGTDFKYYLFPILVRKLKSFYKQKNIELQRERTITNCHTQYQYELDEEENRQYSVAERIDYNYFETNELHKLKYICRNSKTVKKRLFVYIMYLASNLRSYNIGNLCEALSFDLTETMRIIENINILCPENDRTNTIRERRNINWSRQLFLQQDLSIRNYLDDYSMNELYQNRIDHYMDNFKSQTQELSEKKKTVSRTFIAKMLGISVANAGAAVYYTKNVLKYCTGEPQTAQSMGISDHLFKQMEDSSWHFVPEPFEEKVFIPSREFRLSSDLLSEIIPAIKRDTKVEFKQQINYSHFMN